MLSNDEKPDWAVKILEAMSDHETLLRYVDEVVKERDRTRRELEILKHAVGVQRKDLQHQISQALNQGLRLAKETQVLRATVADLERERNDLRERLNRSLGDRGGLIAQLQQLRCELTALGATIAKMGAAPVSRRDITTCPDDVQPGGFKCPWCGGPRWSVPIGGGERGLRWVHRASASAYRMGLPGRYFRASSPTGLATGTAAAGSSAAVIAFGERFELEIVRYIDLPPLPWKWAPLERWYWAREFDDKDRSHHRYKELMDEISARTEQRAAERKGVLHAGTE